MHKGRLEFCFATERCISSRCSIFMAFTKLWKLFTPFQRSHNYFFKTLLLTILLVNTIYIIYPQSPSLDTSPIFFADTDSLTVETQTPADPLKTFTLPKNPTKAALLSAIIPGAGQIYNEKYIKAGVYIGIQATLVGVAIHYDKKYKEYKTKISDKDDPAYPSNFVKYRDYYEDRQSYIFWVATSVFLSTLDAYVDAHLINFYEKKDQIHIKFEGDKITLSIPF